MISKYFIVFLLCSLKAVKMFFKITYSGSQIQSPAVLKAKTLLPSGLQGFVASDNNYFLPAGAPFDTFAAFFT